MTAVFLLCTIILFVLQTLSMKLQCEYSCRMRNPERQGLKDLKRLEMA